MCCLEWGYRVNAARAPHTVLMINPSRIVLSVNDGSTYWEINRPLAMRVIIEWVRQWLSVDDCSQRDTTPLCHWDWQHAGGTRSATQPASSTTSEACWCSRNSSMRTRRTTETDDVYDSDEVLWWFRTWDWWSVGCDFWVRLAFISISCDELWTACSHTHMPVWPKGGNARRL